MKVTIAAISGIMTLSLALQSQRVEQVTVPLSNPTKPGVLIVHHHKGSINVTGYGGTAVVVRASLRYGSEAVERTVDLGAVEKDNHVLLNSGPGHRTIDLDIMVPTHFSLQLKNDDNGTIRVHHLSGEVDASNLNGDIHLVDVAGSAVLDTVDGDISAQFTRLTPGTPMAFTSLEGGLDITLPDDVKVLATMKADRGHIWNEFAPTSESEVPTVGDGTQSAWTHAWINGGGPEIRLRSFNGHVYLRRTEDQQNTSAAVTIAEERSST
jgi:hypothetical protein